MTLIFKKLRGFTFIETILTILIVGVIASVAAKVLVAGLDIYSLVIHRNEAFQTARLSMERMQDEIVLVKSSDIYFIFPASFRFSDATGASTSFTAATKRKGSLTVPIINRGSDFMAAEVTSLSFRYYKLDGSTASLPFDVRRINIDFTVLALMNAGTVHLRSDVFPRNFMYSNFE